MQLYKKLYFGLFNSVTDAIKAIKRNESTYAMEILINAQQNAEELYIGCDAPDDNDLIEL